VLQTTPLAIAFLKGHTGIVDFLLNLENTDINFRDDKGEYHSLTHATVNQGESWSMHSISCDTQKMCNRIQLFTGKLLQFLVKTPLKWGECLACPSDVLILEV
jgi:hypothetical protein